MTLPAGAWRASTQGRAELEMTRVGSKAGILANASCEGNPPTRPLGVLARHLTFGLEARKLLEREEVVVASRQGVRMLLEGQLDGASVAVEAFVLKGKECVYDLIYVASPGDFAAGRAEFLEFVESFTGS